MKNTVYRFFNSIKTNWYCFTTLLSAADDKNLLCEAKYYDGRSLAGKRRSQSRRKAADVMLDLIWSAQAAGAFPISYDALNVHAAIVFTRLKCYNHRSTAGKAHSRFY